MLLFFVFVFCIGSSAYFVEQLPSPTSQYPAISPSNGSHAASITSYEAPCIPLFNGIIPVSLSPIQRDVETHNDCYFDLSDMGTPREGAIWQIFLVPPQETESEQWTELSKEESETFRIETARATRKETQNKGQFQGVCP